MINVGIAGLGLIGASILKGLSNNKNYKIRCFSKSCYKEALKYSEYASDDIKILKESDIVFVCSYYSKTEEVLLKLNSFLNKKTIVCDCASIKGDLANREYNFNFILSHPMAGSTKTGFHAGDKELFQGARWLIGKENKILEDIIKALGAKPVLIDMKNHDALCAQVSHLPAILAFLLFDCAQDEAKRIASSGFRDMTRLAMTNSDLALGMFKNNEKNILNTFELLQKKLDYLKNLSDFEKIKLFDEISKQRKLMYDNDGKNIL